MKISSYDVLPFSDPDKFEDFCCDLWRATWQSPTTQKHGRKGQAQLGVDIYGVPSGGNRYQGVQCKLRSSALGSRITEREIREEIKEAEKFTPPLEHLAIATTSPNDVNLQALAREITLENSAQGLFSVSVIGWGELLLMLDDHDSVARKYFPNMFNSDTLSKKKEALLVEENPTRLEMKELKVMPFLGDSEPYLTLEVANVSKLTAKDLKLSVLLPIRVGQSQSEVAEFTPSRCIDINSIPNYSISGNTTQLIPFASESEAHEKLSGEFISYRLVGVGLSPNIPAELTQQIREKNPSMNFTRISVQVKGFGILLTWSSIFGQEMRLAQGGFLYLWDEADDIRYAELAT